jgi:hypothetical protein
MKDIELCMRYDACKRCPRNKFCEYEFRKQEEAKKHKESKSDT